MENNLTKVKLSLSILFELHTNKRFKRFVDKSIYKFLNNDWGTLSNEDKKINQITLNNDLKEPILGIYKSKRFGTFMIYTRKGELLTMNEIPKFVNLNKVFRYLDNVKL